MFTFKKNKDSLAVAKITGGKLKNKIIYINPKDEDNSTTTNVVVKKSSINKTNLWCPYCYKPFSRRDALMRHLETSCRKREYQAYIKENIPFHVDNYLNEKFGLDSESDSENDDSEDEYKTKINTNKSFNELTLPSGKFQALPNFDRREIVYISGAQGSGKSYYAAQYLKEFVKMFPDKKIYLFSRVEDDEAFRGIEMIRYPLDETFLEHTIDCKKELKNSMCVFDDIDSIQNKKISEAVLKLRDDVIMSGRDQTNGGQDIYCIVTNHQTTDYRETRDILCNATSITLFCKNGGNLYGANRCLKYYCGLDKKQSDKIFKLNSRWVTIYRNYPNYVISENKIYKL